MKLQDNDGEEEDKDYEDCDEYEDPHISTDDEELDKGDIEVINNENVRIVKKHTGPSTAIIENTMKADTKYHLLKEHQKMRSDAIIERYVSCYIHNWVS